MLKTEVVFQNHYKVSILHLYFYVYALLTF